MFFFAFFLHNFSLAILFVIYNRILSLNSKKQPKMHFIMYYKVCTWKDDICPSYLYFYIRENIWWKTIRNLQNTAWIIRNDTLEISHYISWHHILSKAGAIPSISIIPPSFCISRKIILLISTIFAKPVKKILKSWRKWWRKRFLLL